MPEITYPDYGLILSNQKKTSGIVFRGKNTSQTCYRDVTLKKNPDKIKQRQNRKSPF